MATVAFTEAAQQDVVEAVDWYEQQAPGLGVRLIGELAATVDRVEGNPRQYPIVHKMLRRALTRTFPYALFYRATGDDTIEVIAFFHTSRDPRRWRARS
jgi:toxin ParE1/3/4